MVVGDFNGDQIDDIAAVSYTHLDVYKRQIRTSPPKKETAPDVTEAEIIKDLTGTEVHSNEPS